MKSKFQFVNWFPDWHGFHFYKMTPKKSSYYLIYEWFLYLGFWEIRKWQSDSKKALKNYRKYQKDIVRHTKKQKDGEKNGKST